MTTYIFLDDVRNPPDDGENWIIARRATDAEEAMIDAYFDRNGEHTVMSLDHDLGENESTGYDLLKSIEYAINMMPYFRPNIEFRIHSANPVGRDNMARAIQSIRRVLDNDQATA